MGTIPPKERLDTATEKPKRKPAKKEWHSGAANGPVAWAVLGPEGTLVDYAVGDKLRQTKAALDCLREYGVATTIGTTDTAYMETGK